MKFTIFSILTGFIGSIFILPVLEFIVDAVSYPYNTIFPFLYYIALILIPQLFVYFKHDKPTVQAMTFHGRLSFIVYMISGIFLGTFWWYNGQVGLGFGIILTAVTGHFFSYFSALLLYHSGKRGSDMPDIIDEPDDEEEPPTKNSP